MFNFSLGNHADRELGAWWLAKPFKTLMAKQFFDPTALPHVSLVKKLVSRMLSFIVFEALSRSRIVKAVSVQRVGRTKNARQVLHRKWVLVLLILKVTRLK
jgi:hypothetical protein